MRLFHTDFTLSGNQLTITEDRVLKHTKVLRLKIGDELAVQNMFDDVTIRYHCKIVDIDKKKIICEVMSSDQNQHKASPGMLVGMPHTQDKLHWIVQKLTELGVHDIVFRRNDRSTGHDLSPNKLVKLHKISLESVEQCNGRFLPTISQVQNIHEWVVGKELVLFDFGGDHGSSLKGIPTDKLYGVVGPEGHFSPRDYETIGFQVVHKISLGDTILRTETAAVAGAWILQNLT